MAEISGDLNLPKNLTLETFKNEALENLQEAAVMQDVAQDNLKNALEESVNPFGYRLAQKKKPEGDELRRVKKANGTEEKEGISRLFIEKIKQSAQNFEERNPELKAKMLLLLRDQIKPGDTKEEILKKVFSFYSDPALAEEALQFLEETTQGSLKEEVKLARAALNEKFAKEISAARNIQQQVREYSEKGLGAPTALRDLYRDITDNKREMPSLFQELSGRFAYKDLRKVIAFLLHSLGSDLKSSGPSIEPALLSRLFEETRSLQSILGVYTFFRGRMKLLQKLFLKNGLTVPKQLTFEEMAKQFMNFASERYPSSDKVLKMAQPLGIEKWLMAKIIAFSQMRDALRQVSSSQVYRSLQHRDDIQMALIEALEDLEDELEELEERQEKERQDQEEEKEYQALQQARDPKEKKDHSR
ncbi:MAG: sctW, copN [Chlamydiales bacterium]|jgi:type III secretion protein W|nr:sctW, copN [Chlamydiales bacterium]